MTELAAYLDESSISELLDEADRLTAPLPTPDIVWKNVTRSSSMGVDVDVEVVSPSSDSAGKKFPKAIRARGFIRTTKSAAEFCALIDPSNLEGRRIWDDGIKEYESRQLQPEGSLVYTSSKAALGGLISSRDFVSVSVKRPLRDGLCVVSVDVSGKVSDLYPERSSYVRGACVISAFHVAPAEINGQLGLHVTHAARTDLKGWLSHSLVLQGTADAEIAFFKRWHVWGDNGDVHHN